MDCCFLLPGLSSWKYHSMKVESTPTLLVAQNIESVPSLRSSFPYFNNKESFSISRLIDRSVLHVRTSREKIDHTRYLHVHHVRSFCRICYFARTSEAGFVPVHVGVPRIIYVVDDCRKFDSNTSSSTFAITRICCIWLCNVQTWRWILVASAVLGLFLISQKLNPWNNLEHPLNSSKSIYVPSVLLASLVRVNWKKLKKCEKCEKVIDMHLAWLVKLYFEYKQVYTQVMIKTYEKNKF